MSLLISLALLIGIFTWPEATLCFVLFQAGHPLLGLLAIFATFFNGRDFLRNKFYKIGKDVDQLKEESVNSEW